MPKHLCFVVAATPTGLKSRASRLRLTATTLAAALLATVLPSPSLQAQAPGLESLVDTRSSALRPDWYDYSGAQNFPRPVLNDLGTVIFTGTFEQHNWQQVVMKTNQPGVVTSFNDEPALWSTWSSAIDNSDTFVWMHDDAWGSGRSIYTSTPNAPFTYTHHPQTVLGVSISGRSIGTNNNGLISFRTTGPGGNLYLYDSSTPAVPVRILPVADLNAMGSRIVNDGRQVVYATKAGGIFHYNWHTGTTQELQPGGGVTGMKTQPFDNTGVQPALNNEGQFAFIGQNAEDQHGLYLMDLNTPEADALLLDTLAGEPVHAISINDHGQILYIDHENYYDYALKLWDGTQALTLLSTGDEFNGSTVLEIDVSSYAINNHGEIVFGYYLNDGTFGIGYYQAIPEPSTFAVLLAGSAILLAWRRRERFTAPPPAADSAA